LTHGHAAEDTRRTRILLQHYGIATPLISFHEHNQDRRIPQLLRRLAQGEEGALVSDAGTPLINDPGFELVRAALEAGHRVVPVPGPSAVLAALVASGLPAERFLYLGYLPRKPGPRRRALQEVAHLPFTLIFLETPQRLVDTLEDMAAVFGGERRPKGSSPWWWKAHPSADGRRRNWTRPSGRDWPGANRPKPWPRPWPRLRAGRAATSIGASWPCGRGGRIRGRFPYG